MTAENSGARIVIGVGAVIWNALGEVLLIRRANPPKQHEWSLPGGKVEFGEPLRTALLREIREETALEIEIVGLIDVAELVPAPGETGNHYVLVDFTARALASEPVAATDALEARWFSLGEIAILPLWSETRRVIALSAGTLKRDASD